MSIFPEILVISKLKTLVIHRFKQKLCIYYFGNFLVKYPKSGYEKDSEALHFYLKDVRILTPKEYEALKAAIPKDQHKTTLDILLITGMRYAELLRLYDNPAWYNEKRNIIHLPEEAQKKHKRRQLERTIHPLPSMFHYLLKDFWQARKPPLESTWNKNSETGSIYRNESLWAFCEVK